MSLPDAITTITVSAQYVAPDGGAATGVVTFTPSIPAVTPGAVMPAAPLRVVLDDGALAVELAATDDPQWAPAGFTYLVTERIDGARVRSYNIEVPTVVGTLDLASVAPVVDPAIVSPYRLGSRSAVDVRAFGAVGNNIADDTVALQAAINALPLGGGTVYLATGTYRLTAALVLQSGTTLQADGDITCVIRQTNPAANCVQGTNVERVALRGVQLLGPGSGAGHGLFLAKGAGNHVAYTVVEGVTVHDFGGDGIHIENGIVTTLTRVVASSNGGYGVNLAGAVGGAAGTSCTLTGVYGNANATGGIRLYNMVYSALNGCAADHNPIGYLVDSCQSVTLAGCGAEGNATAGFRVNGGYGNTLSGAWVYDNRGIGVHLTGSAIAATLIGAVDNSPAGSATAFVKADPGCRVALLNCNNTTANSLAAGTTNTVTDAGGGAVFQSYTALLSGGECDGDLICYVAGKGYVLTDRANGNLYRLRVTNGVLSTEAV
ncbi:right-handed parallel beta-helix repeat-containing protein [Actinoplanes sp. M2I2]|uniref:right-handed parallel beta-helix repeat-containing protein n=1 Tax=Actinoplanes sp. M2I2 TaxID=1734444 RepID=UPI0020220953|nr:right-handed parallel beta-helix repeat-containing protein [Actinoplanes sp. M2I2]